MSAITRDSILYLCRREIESACQQLDPVEVIQKAFILHATQRTLLPEEAYLGWSNPLEEEVRSLSLSAYLDGASKSAGTKIINSNIRNPGRNLPRAKGGC